MIVILNENGSYLSRLNSAQPSDMSDGLKNYVVNAYFNSDIKKAMKFETFSDADKVVGVIDDNEDLEAKELKQVVFHTGDHRYLRSIKIEQAYSNGRLVAKNVSTWTKDIAEALPFTDQEGLNSIVALTERGENLNGNFGYITTKFV